MALAENRAAGDLIRASDINAIAAAVNASGLSPVVARTGSFTFTLTDAASTVEVTSASATTATIPVNTSVAFPVGTVIGVYQGGTGQVTIAGASGVTVRSRGGLVKTAGQYSEVSLRKRATNEWVLVGDLG